MGTKIRFLAIAAAFAAPFAAFAAREGVPSYYQQNSYQTQQNPYGGAMQQKQVIASSSYTYQQPIQQNPYADGQMTANGIALPSEQESKLVVSGGYIRRFADFQFETGVQSILEWDDMVFNELGAEARYNFTARNFDLFALAEYRRGTLASGGLSMDYDLKPYDNSQPQYGIFTISIGDQSGSTDYMRFGIGARHIWDIAGWKLSPTIGYEIFKHNLEMSNHLYPNPGIYLPLMTVGGNYVYGDKEGNYYSVPVGAAVEDDWWQVCMSPEDIALVNTPGSGSLGSVLPPMTGYTDNMGLTPWGVGPGECVIIGGDGPILVSGTTHIYNTTWSGIYFGLEAEKQMTLSDKLRFYVQVSMPNYSSEGTWPNRTDWQQNPSFIDEGNNGNYAYRAEMEYNHKLSDRLQLALKVDTNYFYVGKVAGELYVSEYTRYMMDANGQYVLDANGYPQIEVVPAHTEKISDSLRSAAWQSFGLHLGVKYAF